MWGLPVVVHELQGVSIPCRHVKGRLGAQAMCMKSVWLDPGA
ncbi:MAG: hypothetical protein R3D67_04630 [Hyphomicrobiaceae bacterium]